MLLIGTRLAPNTALMTLASAASFALQQYYTSLHQHQSSLPMRAQMLDFDQLNALIGTPELLALGKRYE